MSGAKVTAASSPLELFPESVRRFTCDQCVTCGRLLFAGGWVGRILEKQMDARWKPTLNELWGFNLGLVEHLKRAQKDECAVCLHLRREAECRSRGQTISAGMHAVEAERARCFYNSRAYAEEERDRRETMRKELQQAGARRSTEVQP